MKTVTHTLCLPKLNDGYFKVTVMLIFGTSIRFALDGVKQQRVETERLKTSQHGILGVRQ